MAYTIFINVFFLKTNLIKSNTYEHDNILYDSISQQWTYFLWKHWKHVQAEANLTILDLCRVSSAIDETNRLQFLVFT